MAARPAPSGGGRPAPTPRLLGVLLCYNDGDLVEEAVRYLREQGHDVVVWDHGSTDETPAVLRSLEAELLELTTVPRSVDFYRLYQAMSEHLLDSYVDRYDWVSWPDQDEFLEGPDRARPYREWLYEVASSPYDWIQFNNYNFWWTPADDVDAVGVARRVRHYSLFPDCAPRVRSWRASATNIREFNHNPPKGERYPAVFQFAPLPDAQRGADATAPRGGPGRPAPRGEQLPLRQYELVAGAVGGAARPTAFRRRWRARPLGRFRLALGLRQRGHHGAALVVLAS